MSETGEISKQESIDQVKKELISPLIISKRTDPEGRKSIAGEILQARKEKRENRDELSQNLSESSSLNEQHTNLSQQADQGREDLVERQANKLVKLKALLRLGDAESKRLQAKIDLIDRAIIVTETQWDATYAQNVDLVQKQEQIPDPKELLEAYYEKVASTPLSNQEKRELLTPEVLASLTTDEYIALWKRLNPYFLAHVTRQGFRDHTGEDIMTAHNSGYRESVNGFTDVMQNGRSIFPPLARVGLINRDEATVRSFLDNFLPKATSPSEARKNFVNFLNWSLAAAPTYPDITATHLAAQIVSDNYYGGERENEVFFVYPSDVLASQYPFAFNGWEKDFTNPQSEVKWNDVFIWTDPDKPGIPVDSGIVFLPKSTPVDPETGSKYASEVKVIDGVEKRVMIEDPTLVSAFVEWGKKLDEQSPLIKAYKVYSEERRHDYQQDLRYRCVEAFVQELQVLGFKNDTSLSLTNRLMRRISYLKDPFGDTELEQMVKETGAHFKLAQNPIPAEEYWEKYFSINQNLRPKHVFYYDGNPSTAIYKFQQKNNIGKADTSQTDGMLLGFDDNHVADMEKDPRANKGYRELIDMASIIIEEHYRIPTVV